MARKVSNKRERLLKAADELFLQKGTDLTTLADIAHASDVPLGNVYYYFKTKGEIISDVNKYPRGKPRGIKRGVTAPSQDSSLDFLCTFLQLANCLFRQLLQHNTHLTKIPHPIIPSLSMEIL